MLHFVTSYMNQNRKGKQTLKSAQYRLEIMFKYAGTHLFTWVEWGTVRVKCRLNLWRNKEFTFSEDVYSPSRSLHPTQSSLPFCTDFQFYRDAIRMLNVQIKIQENRMWTVWWLPCAHSTTWYWNTDTCSWGHFTDYTFPHEINEAVYICMQAYYTPVFLLSGKEIAQEI